MNRLGAQTSLYLRQHANNPVDWYVWGPEAFDEAKRLDRPVFVSIGYSSCHWCHVMAHESFEDPRTAEFMNSAFVNIKVDREERPDVDAVCIEAVQAITGHAGWPLSLWMTPEAKPFFGGTYFPPQPSGNMPSFLEVCSGIKRAWSGRRDELLQQSRQIIEAIDRFSQAEQHHLPDVKELISPAVAQIETIHDSAWGGFSKAPKFPQPSLLRMLALTGQHPGEIGQKSTNMLTSTLDAMARGGIYDHLSGGFSRYSTDQFWMVPHFEKMLYDQALISLAYLDGYRLTANHEYKVVAEQVLSYVLDDFGTADGAFCAARDADSQGEEGAYYLWKLSEVSSVIGQDSTERFAAYFGLTQGGNFEGSNILHRQAGTPLELPEDIEAARLALLSARHSRVAPTLDEKVILEWNAYTIEALSSTGMFLDRPDFVERASKAADYLIEVHRDASGRWLRSSWQGSPGPSPAVAADLGALVSSLISLFLATSQDRWLQVGVEVAQQLLENHEDQHLGGFHTSAHDGEKLFAAHKELFDGATPSANALSCSALARLAVLVDNPHFSAAAQRGLALLGRRLREQPGAFPTAIVAMWHLQESQEIVLPGDRGELFEVALDLAPLQSLILSKNSTISPLFANRDPMHAYVCRQQQCLLPVDNVDALSQQLRGLTRDQFRGTN